MHVKRALQPTGRCNAPDAKVSKLTFPPPRFPRDLKAVAVAYEIVGNDLVRSWAKHPATQVSRRDFSPTQTPSNRVRAGGRWLSAALPRHGEEVDHREGHFRPNQPAATTP